MKFSVAIAISVGVHVLLGVGLGLYLECAPAPGVTVTLDLSGVELSFAEREDDTAAVLPQPPTPELPTPGSGKTRGPESVAGNLPGLPPIPAAVDIPRPGEKPELKAPDAPKPGKRPGPGKKVDPEPTPSAPAPAAAPRQAKIDAPPRPERAIRPDYPRGARRRGEQGDVLVEMSVNAEGRVDRAAVTTSCGFPELDEAALRAVRAARFIPAESGGKRVSSSARIRLTFKLKRP